MHVAENDERRADYLLLGRMEQAVNDLADGQKEIFGRLKSIENSTAKIEKGMDDVMTPGGCAVAHAAMKADIIKSMPKQKPVFSSKVQWILILALAAIAIMATSFAFGQRVTVPGLITVEQANSMRVPATPIPGPVTMKGK